MNVLIVGLGSIANRHIGAMKKIRNDWNFYALRSGKSNSTVEGVHNIFSLDILNIKLDFIIVSNPTQLRKEAIEQVLSLNAPLFIEKPPMADFNGSNKIIAQIKNQKLISYVACVMRFHPALLYLKHHLEAQKPKVNEVNVYCGTYLPDWRPQTDFRKSYSANADMGGGVHLDLFHEIDFTCWLFGLPLEVTKRLRNNSTLCISAVDYANYLFEYEGFAVSIVMNYYRRDPKRTLEVVFDNDTWTIDIFSNDIKNMKGEFVFKSEKKILDLYVDQMNYFLNCVSTCKDSNNSFESSVEILKYCIN